MAGRTSFSTLRNRMSPEAQERARVKSEALEGEMALAGVRKAMQLSQEELAAILNINQGIAVAGAVLWHRGYKQIAALLTSQSTGPSVTETLLLSGAGRSRFLHCRC